MKKVFFIGAMLLCGMMFNGNVANAQCDRNQFKEGGNPIGYGVGHSVDEQTATDDAFDAALKEIARKTSSVLQDIVERDKRDELEKGLISREQISKLTQQASTQITQMNVREIKTLCQNCEEKSNGEYRCTCVLEYDKAKLAEQAYKELQENRLISSKKEMKEFRQKFNETFKN